MRRAVRRFMGKSKVWILLACVMLLIPVCIVITTRITGNSKSLLSRPMSSTSVQPPIVKLMNEKYIEYKLYGRVVKAGKETTKGIPVIFVVNADPVQTVLAGLIQHTPKGYELIRYDAKYDKRVSIDYVSDSELTIQALSSSRPLELKIRFMKINISGDDQSNINSLDAVIRGDWKAMPTKQLIIETIGLSGRI